MAISLGYQRHRLCLGATERAAQSTRSLLLLPLCAPWIFPTERPVHAVTLGVSLLHAPWVIELQAIMSDNPNPPKLSFDRGTLLLERADRELAGRLPGMLWDPRTRNHRAPGWRYRELLAVFAEEQVLVDDQVKGHLQQAQGAWHRAELRSYQQMALSAWELGDHRGIVVLPTGSGKTRLALAAAQSVAPAAVLCLVPTRVLLHQWLKELAGCYAGELGCWGDGRHTTAPVTVATFESALRYAPRIGARFELLVIDEVHHFGDRLKDEALEMCVAPMRLGLTATLPVDEVQLERLFELVGPVQYELSIADLAGTYLAEYDTVVLAAPLTAQERAAYRAEHAAFAHVYRAFRQVCPAAPWGDFVKAASRSDEGRRALAAWRRSRQIVALPAAKRALVAQLLTRHQEGKVLIFTPDNPSAYEIARSELVMPLTCDIERRERDEVLERFRRNELRVLVSSRVLNEGLDVPDTDVAIVVGGALGEREHVQRVGRLLRPSPGKRALVYELVATGTSEAQASLRRRRALAARIVTAPVP